VTAVAAARSRAGHVARIRRFFDQRGVIEVQTPLITRSGVTDVHLQSLALADGRFLRTSPEHAHKRLLADGMGDLYELGPVFRAGEHGRLHREEFTMLEWYRVGWSWDELAGEVIELISGFAPQRPVNWIRWRDLAGQALGFDPLTRPQRLEAALRDAPADLDTPEQLDWLFSFRMQPSLPDHGIAVVHDFPISQAALACAHPDHPEVALRFEVFVDRIELANGYQELTDPEEQRRRFNHDKRRRQSLGMPDMPIDTDLLAALERGLPKCAGVALGVDRLLMLANGESALPSEGTVDMDAN